ncbi:unannotated protein [freshwater metagenome]|uniref:Unannotated protein n=1 Tax=freshwater metagenome TaxID=449393 RepID=A0A6J7VLN0_9ZZZZ
MAGLKETRDTKFKRGDRKQCSRKHGQQGQEQRHDSEAERALQGRLAVFEGFGNAAEKQQGRKQHEKPHGLPDEVVRGRGVDGGLRPSANTKNPEGANGEQKNVALTEAGAGQGGNHIGDDAEARDQEGVDLWLVSDPQHLIELNGASTEGRASVIAVVDPNQQQVGEQHRQREQPDRSADEHREREHRDSVERHARRTKCDRGCEHTNGAEKQRNDQTAEGHEREADGLFARTAEATVDERRNNEDAR